MLVSRLIVSSNLFSVSILLAFATGSHGEDVKLVSYYATPSMPYREGDDPNSNYEGCSLVDLSGNMLKCRPPGVLFDGKVDGSLNISNQINRYKYHTWNTSKVTLIFELDRPVVFQSVRLLYLSNNNVKDIGNAPKGKPLVYTTNSSTTTEPGMPNRARHISSETQQGSEIYSANYSGFDDEYGSVLHLTFDFGSTKWFFLTAAEIRVNDAGREYKVTSFVPPVEESSPIPSSTMSPTGAATPSDTPPTSTSPSPTSTPSGATTVAVKSEIYVIVGLAVVIAALILVVGSVIVCLLCKTKRMTCFTSIPDESEYEEVPPPIPHPKMLYANPAYSTNNFYPVYSASNIYEDPLEMMCTQSEELEVTYNEVDGSYKQLHPVCTDIESSETNTNLANSTDGCEDSPVVQQLGELEVIYDVEGNSEHTLATDKSGSSPSIESDTSSQHGSPGDIQTAFGQET